MKRLAAGLLAGWMLLTGLGLAEESQGLDESAEDEIISEQEEETSSGKSGSAQEDAEEPAWYEEFYKDTDEQDFSDYEDEATPSPAKKTAATPTPGKNDAKADGKDAGKSATPTPSPEKKAAATPAPGKADAKTGGKAADEAEDLTEAPEDEEAAAAEEEDPDAAEEPADEDELETEDTESEPYRLIEDPDNGRWEYHSASLNIVIEKISEKVKVGKKNLTREYAVADIQASPDSPLYPIMTDPTKKRPAGYRLTSPKNLVKKYKPLFAMSDDLYGIRLQKYDYKGIVIRDGEILATKTRNSKKKRNWPNLDTMMLLKDGSMKAQVCDAYTAEEYLNLGATQVFSFGPILVTDGEINEQVLSPTYYPYNEPRVALGMVEPYHYVAVVVRGRPKNRYAGVHLDWLAQLMKERGCVEALNLDGGLTATMMFNGKMIITGGNSLRSQGSMICFGTMPE